MHIDVKLTNQCCMFPFMMKKKSFLKSVFLYLATSQFICNIYLVKTPLWVYSYIFLIKISWKYRFYRRELISRIFSLKWFHDGFTHFFCESKVYVMGWAGFTTFFCYIFIFNRVKTDDQSLMSQPEVSAFFLDEKNGSNFWRVISFVRNCNMIRLDS